MNRSLALAVLSVLVLLAAGCGGGGKKASSAPATTSAKGKTIKVGLVTDVGGLNDRGFNHLAYLGVLEAKTKLGVQYRVSLSSSSAEYVPNLTALARGGYDIGIGVGFTDATPIEPAAHPCPHTT